MDLYADSLSLSERIAVDRFRAEALLGQVVAYGIQGKVEHARAVAGEAVAILEAAGDQYLAAIVWLALGAAATQASRPEAAQWIDTGTRLAARAGDGYCLCVGDLWRSIGALEAEDWDTFDVSIGRLLVQAHEQGYACLLTAQPFLGVHDRRVLVELLGAAARRGIQQGSARRLLAEIAPADARRLDDPARYHAKLLGAFELVEGTRAVAGDAWGRDKALALFQFLVVHRGRAVHREQIQEALWPGSRPDASALGLRVALSALHRAVEPARGKAESPTLVRREGPTLKLDAALLRCDLDEFEEALAEARSAEAAADVLGSLDCLRSALSIYRGDLLEDRPYDEWVAEHRRPLRGSYLRAGIRAATLLADLGDTDEAIEVCERLIADEPAFEEPYALLMRLHARAGNRALATRTFDRCLAALGDVAASKEILGLRDAIATGTS